ncbi:unnamed protein product [Mytilus coruscus]|uniref:Uncharacterized protein n=1 Tax=Mytilus coruscus TaxID=42192 RepID=A0A6J8E739_MYTCO|nr:unnamed protein product [Mytilus coruscus]
MNPLDHFKKGVSTTWKITSDTEMDIQTFLEVRRGKRMDKIQNCGFKGVKINVVLHCTFVKINPTGKDDDENEGHFNSGNRSITEATDLFETLKEMDQKIGEKLAQWTCEKKQDIEIGFLVFDGLMNYKDNVPPEGLPEILKGCSQKMKEVMGCNITFTNKVMDEEQQQSIICKKKTDVIDRQPLV